MHKRESIAGQPIATSDKELASVLGVGVGLARKFSEEAGARFSIGNRKLNNMKKVQEYMDMICEGGGNVADVIDIKGKG